MEKNRWYDQYPELSQLIEKIKVLSDDEKNEVLIKIKDIVIKHDAKIIDSHVMEFPMSSKRRWYDKDPYSWLVINALKFASEDLINIVTDYLKEKIG